MSVFLTNNSNMQFESCKLLTGLGLCCYYVMGKNIAILSKI